MENSKQNDSADIKAHMTEATDNLAELYRKIYIDNEMSKGYTFSWERENASELLETNITAVVLHSNTSFIKECIANIKENTITDNSNNNISQQPLLPPLQLLLKLSKKIDFLESIQRDTCAENTFTENAFNYKMLKKEIREKDIRTLVLIANIANHKKIPDDVFKLLLTFVNTNENAFIAQLKKIIDLGYKTIDQVMLCKEDDYISQSHEALIKIITKVIGKENICRIDNMIITAEEKENHIIILENDDIEELYIRNTLGMQGTKHLRFFIDGNTILQYDKDIKDLLDNIQRESATLATENQDILTAELDKIKKDYQCTLHEARKLYAYNRVHFLSGKLSTIKNQLQSLYNTICNNCVNIESIYPVNITDITGEVRLDYSNKNKNNDTILLAELEKKVFTLYTIQKTFNTEQKKTRKDIKIKYINCLVTADKMYGSERAMYINKQNLQITASIEQLMKEISMPNSTGSINIVSSSVSSNRNSDKKNTSDSKRLTGIKE